MESRNQFGVEVTWEIDGQQDTLEASVMVDRQWRDKSTGGMVWGSEQTVEGKALTFANSDEGRGFRELVGQFARRDLLSIGAYLMAQGVKWPVSEGSVLNLRVNNTYYPISSVHQRKALYYIVEVASRLAGENSGLWAGLLAKGFIDSSDEVWTDRRVENFNRRRIEGMRVVTAYLTQS